MGFWDFVAPDYDRFREALLPLLPEAVLVGRFVVSAEDAIDAAWVNPGSAAGLAARLYYSTSTYQVARPLADALNGELQSQGATAGGFGTSGAGGNFAWQSREVQNMVLVIPNAYRVSIEAVSGGQAVTNVVGVTNGAGTALGAAQAVQAAWKVTAGPLTQIRNNYTLQGFRALDIGDVNGDIAFVADSTAGGITAGSVSTNAACALVKWNGGTRSRSSRGRLYHGPLSEGQIDADGRTLAATSRTSIQAAYAAFVSSLASAGYPLAVLSPTLSQAFPVTSVAVETIIATQRRRIRS